MGGFLSENEIQIGISILSVAIMVAARFPCSRVARKTTRFQKMQSSDDGLEIDDNESADV